MFRRLCCLCSEVLVISKVIFIDNSFLFLEYCILQFVTRCTAGDGSPSIKVR